MPDITFTVSIPSAPAGLAPITMASSITDGGVTFNFNKSVPTVTSATGRQAVLSTDPSGFEITSTSPASAVVNGGWAHGMIENAYIPTFGPQAFDEFLASGNDSASTAFDNTDNVDPGKTGSNIVIAQGDQKSFVKSKRNASVTTAAGQWDTVESYGELHILSSQPAENFLMPSASATTKRIFSSSDIDWTVFRSLSLASTFGLTPTTMLAKLPINAGNWGSVGEVHRRFRLDSNGDGYAPSNYAADISPVIAQACVMLHDSRYTQAQKEPLLYRLLEWGIQLDGIYDRGWRGIGSLGGGAGQSGGGWNCYYWLAGFALQDTQMITRASDIASPFKNSLWVNAANIDELNARLSNSNEGDVGLPIRAEQIDTAITNADADFGGNFERRYDAIAKGMIFREMVPLALLKDDPVSNRHGIAAFLNGDTGQDSWKTAAVAVAERVATVNNWPSSGRDVNVDGLPSVWRTDVEPLGVIPTYTQAPEEIHHGTDPTYGDGFFTAEPRGYSFDFSSYDFSMETKTDWESRYSLDGVQFVEVTHASDTDTVSGLLPVTEHYVGFRFGSASGMAPWSSNYQSVNNAGVGEINKVTTQQGAASSPTAPSFTTNPVIHGAIAEKQKRTGYWIPLSGAIDAKYITLSCGAGYVDGDEAPTFTYQWNRNGSPISGATSKEYSRVREDSGATITCTITPSNATSGAGTAYTTAGISSPVVAALPATKLIDTDFGSEFAVDYSTELANVSGFNTTATHVPFETFGSFSDVGGDLEGVNEGALRFNKTGAFPSGILPLRNLAQTNKTYSYTIEGVFGGTDFGTGFERDQLDSANSFSIRIQNEDGELDGSGELLPVSTADPFKYVQTGTFSTSGLTGTKLSSIKIRLKIDTSTGGVAESDIYITSAVIEEVV